MEQEQAIELIQEKIDEIDINQMVQDDILLQEWRSSTEGYLIRVFDEKSREVTEFNSIHYYSMYVSFSDYSNSDVPHITAGLQKAQVMLNRFVKDIQKFGLPKHQKKSHTPKSSPGIVINNANHNQQSQEMNVNFILNNILDELEDEDKQELKTQLEAFKKGDVTFKGLARHLGSLGKGVIENILASIITNPTLLEQLLSKL